MSNPVWVLSVDLQTKTATFQSGMAEAARSARSAFGQINEGAAGMGESVGRGSLDVRHALGLVDNTIRGAHSMAMADLIRMFKDSALVMGALPFAMTAAGFALVAEMVVKGVQAYEAYEQAQERLRDSQTKMHTAILDVFNGLDEKILEAQRETDELTGNHLAALHKQLELIDHQSLSELLHSFESIEKAADQAFGDLKSSWYEMGIGSEGAKHALDEFTVSYQSLLAQKNEKGASDLLAGTLETAKKVQALQQAAQADAEKHRTSTYLGGGREAYQKYIQDINALKAYGVGISDKEVQSQQALIDALNAQVEVEQKISSIKSAQDTNARLQTAHEMTKQGESVDSKVSAGRARMMSDLYAEYEQKVAIVQQGERETVEATKQGSAERLAAIEDAMHREEADGLQDTAFYKSLSIQKLEVQRELAQQAAQQAAAVAREQAANTEKMGLLQLEADKEQAALRNSFKHVSQQEQMQQAIQFANEEYAIKMQELQAEVSGLDTTGNEYLQKLKQLQDQEKQLTQQHENDIGNIKGQAAKSQAQEIIAAYHQYVDATSQALTQSIMGHETWAHALISLGDQVISSRLQEVIKSAMLDDFDKEKDAAKAARKFFLAGAQLPFPANIVAAPVLAAGAFATVMAFETGTDRVPGVGKGDTVPAMLTPGEGVVPGGVMDGLRNIARNGGFDANAGTHVHLHGVSFAPKIHALDADGVDKVLTKHADQFQKHFQSALRKMNR